MKAKIKKGIRPFGGRIMKVLRIVGNTVVIEAGPKRGTFGYFSDPREYTLDEVELIEEIRS